MKKIRLLTVTFDAEIRSWEIPAFRGAVIEKAGRENTLFHNHLNGEAYLYKYPLIQYKRIGGKPCILCVDYGVDEIHKFFEKKDWSIKISDRWLDMNLENLNLNQFTMQVWDKKFQYRIYDWVALNQENFKKYQEMESVADKIGFLEKTLVGNILSFAKGIEWEIDKPVEVKITSFEEPRRVKIKEKAILGFNLDFVCNVFIPNYIGLGKSVSLGYGVVKQKRSERSERTEKI